MNSTASAGLLSSHIAGPRIQRPCACCWRQRRGFGVVTNSYQDGGNGKPFGNTASGQNRAALTEALDVPIDVSREAVTTQAVPAAGSRKSYKVSFFDAMKFNAAPERINGRLAMLGFALGGINEVQHGLPILDQARAAPIFVVGVAILFSWASLVPVMKGARSEAFGIFSPRAEVTNGRAAMLGIAALLYLEHAAGASFF